jgi:hypothetical protein
VAPLGFGSSATSPNPGASYGQLCLPERWLRSEIRLITPTCRSNVRSHPQEKRRRWHRRGGGMRTQDERAM